MKSRSNDSTRSYRESDRRSSRTNGLPRREFLTRASAATVLATLLPRPAMGGVTREGPPSESLIESYDLAPDVTYLNHASIGTVPRVVREAHAAYLRTCEENPWLYTWGGGFDEALEETRDRAAAFVGCDPVEMALTRNTTEAFNQLALGLPLADGDEVLFSSLNHVGASACWHHHARRRGFTVRSFEFPVERVPELTDAEVVELHRAQITPRTRVLVFPHLDNVVGLRHPVRALADMARAEGVEFIAVDAAQTIGMLPVNVNSLNVDFLATSAHKWLQAPKGLGLFYVRHESQRRLRPVFVTFGQARWQGIARKYEDYGTRDLPRLLALGDAIRFQEELVERRDRDLPRLFESVRERVEAASHLRWRGPASFERGGSLCAIEVLGTSSAEVFHQLWNEHGLVFRAFQFQGQEHIRISPNLATCPEHLERLFEALEQFVG